jgi:hypothetical protein
VGFGWIAEIDRVRDGNLPQRTLRSTEEVKIPISRRTERGEKWGTRYPEWIVRRGFWRDVQLIEQFGAYLDTEADGERLRDRLIRKLLKIRMRRGWPRFWTLNRAQAEYSGTCSKRNIVLKARQVGITTYIAARYFVQTMTRPGTLTVQVAHDDEGAEAIFRIVHRFWEHLPRDLQNGPVLKSRSNTRQIIFPRLDSEYRVESADNNAGRGMTIHNLHCSEVSRWPRGGDETLASLRAAVVPQGEIVLESTPQGASGLFYEEWMKAEENGYTKHFFPWWYEPTYKTKVVEGKFDALSDEESKLVEREGLTREQIAWRRKQWVSMRGQGPQEYAEDDVSCFLASQECVFEMEAIERAAALASKPVEMKENGKLLVWLPPQKGREYIVGVDTAGGGSEGDYACAQVIERSVGLQCAELQGHYPPYELARRLVTLGRRYENALLAVERNNHGYGVLAHLKEIGYENLYVQGNQEGWLTSVVSRPAMIENLVAVLTEKADLFRSQRLLKEMKTFVRHPDGHAAAAEGAHDDCVMAMAIALAVRKGDVGKGRRKGVEVASLEMG